MHQRPALRVWTLCFLLCFSIASTAVAEDDLLLPEQAFPVAAKAVSPDTVSVSWEIVDGYYLYKNKIRFRSDTPGVTLGEPTFPPAKIKHDEFFGEVEIYRGTQTVIVPLHRAAESPDRIALEVSSQGCADRGICYPPQRQSLTLELPPATVASAQKQKPGLDALADLSRDLGLGGEDDLLDPEDAFRFDGHVEEPGRLRLLWTIADGTYLYKEKIRIDLEDASGATLGVYELPPGKLKKICPGRMAVSARWKSTCTRSTSPYRCCAQTQRPPRPRSWPSFRAALSGASVIHR